MYNFSPETKKLTNLPTNTIKRFLVGGSIRSLEESLPRNEITANIAFHFSRAKTTRRNEEKVREREEHLPQPHPKLPFEKQVLTSMTTLTSMPLIGPFSFLGT